MPSWSSFDPEADRKLVRGLNEGDRDALAMLYDSYGERLYDYSMSLAQEPKAAADLVHDSFIDAYRRAPRMRDRMQLRSWLYGAVRRRCMQRARGRGLYWDWSGEPDTTGELAPQDARALLEAAMERLDFADQEVLLLSARHGLAAGEVAAVTGVSIRRAAVRTARARSRAGATVTAAMEVRSRACAGSAAGPFRGRGLNDLDQLFESAEKSPEEAPGKSPEDATEDAVCVHAEGCRECRARGGVSVAALLTVPPAPVLPATLRHRVMHTGTDVELAGYRADIAARGGALTAEGMPRQPDVASPVARRWIFTGGGMAGALATALVAILLIGPGLPTLDLALPRWPMQPVGPEKKAPSGHSAKHSSGPRTSRGG
jgi:RNA polymerase sigma factor (sigma-70 family)